mmetsp:Transcript_25546/g.41939  ORF Transcript_25546/g.41939 Transcript_25546/m.41939 type:complete len:198 (+) Transcript_25546:302-895(+)
MLNRTFNTSLQKQPIAPSESIPPKQVRFGYVTIRNYDMTLGDNPSCAAGPPVCLDWNYEQIPALPIREFERFKSTRPRVQRTSHLAIAPEFRRGILLRTGFTSGQIQEAERQVAKIQNQRALARLSFPFYRVEYAMRSAGRKFQRSTQSLKTMGGEGNANPAKDSNIALKNLRDDDTTVLSDLDLDDTLHSFDALTL